MTKKNLVKQVLMSIVTVVTVFGFTACSEDTLEESYGMAEKKAAADKSMVEKYHASVNGNLPLSVVKMSEMEHVAQATANVMQSVKANLGGNYADLTGMIHYGYLSKKANFNPEYNFFFDAGDFISRYASESDYQQWKQALDKAVVLKRIGYRWDTANIWRYAFVDFEMTEEKFHGVSMFIPQAPTIGEYAKMNEDIKQMEWAGAISLL